MLDNFSEKQSYLKLKAKIKEATNKKAVRSNKRLELLKLILESSFVLNTLQSTYFYFKRRDNGRTDVKKSNSF